MADPIYDPNALFGGASTQTNPDAGNTPFTQVYGQRRSSPLSMDEYLSGSMYDFPGINTGIDVSAAPDLDEDEKDKDQAAPPNILTPVSERTNDPSSVFRAISQGGQLGTGYRVSAKDPSKYLDDLINAETFTVKEDGFSKYAQQKFTEGGGAATAVASLATGMPLTVLGAGAAAFAQKQNKKNAQAILQTGGGDLFELNGATVSRAPGERIFTGNLGGFSQGQLYAAREMDFGFIPGSMREMVGARATAEIGAGPTGIPTTRTGNRGVQAAGKVSGHIMDAYGTIHGVSDESGVMQVGAIAAQRMRENEFRQNMIAAGLRSELNNMIADKSFTMNAVRAKQHTDGIMKAGQGFRFRAANVPADQYAKALNDRGKTYQDYVKSTHGTTSTTKVDTSQPDDFVPSVTESRSEANRIREAERDAAFERGQAVRDRMMDQGVESDPQETSPTQYSMSDFADDYAASYEGVTDFGFRRGGRVDMAEGDTPQGTFEPGFVEGPPENFTERETVADDQNGKVTPDTFIINAAAVEIAGSEDIRKMLMKAYEVAVQKGLDIGRVDRKLYEGTVDVALSKGEVVVPPELAKIIGYDRLRKINNRGKKEVASRQKKAGGGFLDGKKFADGGDVGEDIPFDQSIPIDDSTRKVFKTFLKSKRQRGDVENLIDSLDDRGRLFVLGLVETTASTDSVESMTGVMQTAVNRANTNRPSFKNVNDLASVMKQRSSRGTGSRMFQYDGLEPKKITPRLREVVQGRVPNAVSKLFTAAENLMNPETEGQRPLPSDIMFYTKPDAPLAKDFEDNPKMRYFTSFGGHDYYALDAAPEGFVNN